MPRDSSGNYTLPSVNPVIPGTIIDVDWANPTMDDIAAQLNNVVTRDGTVGLTGPLPLPNGSVSNPSLTFGSETTTGIFKPVPGSLAITILGTEVTRFLQDKVIFYVPIEIPLGSTIGGFEIGYRGIPKTVVGIENGKCYVTTQNVTIQAADVATGRAYSVYNDSANSIVISAGAGVTLKVGGSPLDVDYNLPPYSMLTVWCDTDVTALIASDVPITAGDVDVALGYTPYDAANPAGYLNAITAAQVIAALGYNPVAPAGTFATGTWNININGNAATASSVTGITRAIASAAVPTGDSYTQVAFSSAAITGAAPPARAPDAVNAYWQCNSAQVNYVPGDRVFINDIDGQFNVNATGWGFVWEGTGPYVFDQIDPNFQFNIDPAKWSLIFTAIWLP